VWDQPDNKKPRTHTGVMDGVTQIKFCILFYHPDCFRRHLNHTGSAPLSGARGLLPPVEEFHLTPKNTANKYTLIRQIRLH
jgi:hypothetical protein